MFHTILGTKLKQDQEFTSEGKRIPVTFIQAGPCWISRIQTDENRVTSIQLGYGTKKHLTGAETGHLEKAGLKTKLRFLREFTAEGTDTDIKPGQEIKAGDVFTDGDAIQVIGVSKGKGFAGVVKRHHFKGGPRTHGQSARERAPGSIGQTTTPGRVYRGKRMAGRMGCDRVTLKNLKVVAVDAEKNLLTIFGILLGGT